MTLPTGWEGPDHNFLGIDEPRCHADQAGVYVLPAPYEHTSSYILGSDRGPSAIPETSCQAEFYDEQLGCEPFREWGGIATASALDVGGKVDRAAVEAIESFVSPHVGTGRFVVTLTGGTRGPWERFEPMRNTIRRCAWCRSMRMETCVKPTKEIPLAMSVSWRESLKTRPSVGPGRHPIDPPRGNQSHTTIRSH